jgi:hypothetical protein
LALTLMLLMSACATPHVQAPLAPPAGFAGPAVVEDAFVVRDGARLTMRVWGPVDRAPDMVFVALHGMNDSSAAWRLAGPWWAEQGVVTYAYDQRGFGRSPGRGVWGGALMLDDLRDVVDLVRMHELLGVFQIHLFPDEHVEQVRVDVPVELELAKYLERFGEGLALLVGTIGRGQRLEYVGDSHHPRLHAHVFALEPARVTLAIHPLMVAAGILGYVLQVFWPRQRLKHLDRDLYVVVDDLPLRCGQRACTDSQVFNFVGA